MSTINQSTTSAQPVSTGNKIFNALIIFSRIFVGGLFIVSGMVKANDPLGFSYKLEEYFSEAALGWTFFEPYSLLMGVLVSCGEIILGFAILFGGKAKLTIWLLLLLTVFFGILTFYTAKCDQNGTYKAKETVEVYVAADGTQTPVADVPQEEAAGMTKKTIEKEVERPVQCVTDCGCFGDALKGTIGRSLTPWESFSKDMVLLFFVLILFIGQKRIKLNNGRQDAIVLGGATLMLVLFAGYFFQWWFPVIFSLVCFAIYLLMKKSRKYTWISSEWSIAIVMSIASFGFAWYCYSYLPVKDFTPYAVGKSIPEGMKSAEELGLKPPVYGFPYNMVNKNTGEAVTVRSDEWLANKKWQGPEWEIKTVGKQVEITPGYVPPIPALSLYYESDSGQVDLAQDIINNPSKKVLVLVMYSLEKASTGKMKEINALYEEATKNGYLFYCATAAGMDECNKFSATHGCKFPYVNGDEQGILKPMVRSNPGLLLLDKGVILGKWHYNTFPDFEEVKATHL